MLTQLCQELHNWFDRGKGKYFGTITIGESGTIFCSNTTLEDTQIEPLEGQYFRVIGSVFNDGVHQYPDPNMTEETFEDGAVWLMAVPPAVVELANEIKDWQDKYGALDSGAMSPYQSESFMGYSYSKSSGGSASGSNYSSATWQGAFANRLNMWRKI